jgi:RNA polymerase sigma factor (sigma-70 family)
MPEASPNSTPGDRFPFLTRALRDSQAGERLGNLLSDPALPDETEEALLTRIRNELVAYTDSMLRREFPRLRDQLEPYDLVKEFAMALPRTFAKNGMNMQVRKQFFAAAAARIRGIVQDHLRRQRLAADHARGTEAASQASPLQENLESEEQSMVLEAVDRLDPELKHIFDLKMAGLTYRQIEANVGIPSSTAQRRLQAAFDEIAADIGRRR